MVTQRRFHGQDIISWICLCDLMDMIANLAMCLASGGLFLGWLMYVESCLDVCVSDDTISQSTFGSGDWVL
ncbi:hypothetical protein M438DRAFT_74708 [Aureobasidium pullulans EXF-150]|uniref:Uncharacterized protein n=1 Tax=Aureobasidium pullulans EXF-150 TaxID=1043002 RepID=A0A074X7W9_AURPU|nr:uncharacterized protein M438DRAFT_74708 [Aureobasidium pullulans EXF-150]KEQ81488.1 hypothetical protein M438DRAFT_74708 [Aureobasidium pullulans EXF-150]